MSKDHPTPSDKNATHKEQGRELKKDLAPDSNEKMEDTLAQELRSAIHKEDELGQAQLKELEEQASEIASSISPQNDHNPNQQSEDPQEHKPEPWISEEAFSSFFERVGSAANQAIKLARRTSDTSYKVGKALIQSQDQLKLMVQAGESLKDLREVAGLTASELSDAINLKDKSLIEAVENGTATLSFELILRLSALLARNDPIPFILKYSRTYSPETWKLLHDWGAGRLPLQYQREREFINIYRSKDQARQLSDEGYARVLAYTREAFNMALHFVEEQENKDA